MTEAQMLAMLKTCAVKAAFGETGPEGGDIVMLCNIVHYFHAQLQAARGGQQLADERMRTITRYAGVREVCRAIRRDHLFRDNKELIPLVAELCRELDAAETADVSGTTKDNPK